MGKGNSKSFIGKLFRKSYGKYRPRKRGKRQKQNSINSNREKIVKTLTNASEHVDTKIIPKFNNVLEYLKKGDIVRAYDKEKHKHPIVFLEAINNYSFKSCILSTKSTGENIPMNATLFCANDEKGNPFKLPNNKQQYLVSEDLYIKMDYWIESESPEGHLTEEGISFVEKHVTSQPMLCTVSIKEQKSQK
jgi:ribosomal small subunit protein bTHX